MMFFNHLKIASAIIAVLLIWQSPVCAQNNMALALLPTYNPSAANADTNVSALAATIDTVACIFRQVMPNHHPAVSWQSGFVLLENKQLKVDGNLYPVKRAPLLNGTMQNYFLLKDKKTVVKNKIIQVVIL